MTKCNQDRFEFACGGTRQIVAEFSGGTITSDGGSLLLKETDTKMNLLTRFSQCFSDRRSPLLIEHTLEQMLRQRVYGLALGYEDLNDHDQLRLDPLLGVMAGKAEPGINLLAGKSTLNRMELGTGTPSRYKKITFWRDSVDELLVDVFLEAHPVAPEQIVLDIDTTDMALHGNQEDKFYHGYYKHYCYLPLYIFCGDDVLCRGLTFVNGSFDQLTQANLSALTSYATTPIPDPVLRPGVVIAARTKSGKYSKILITINSSGTLVLLFNTFTANLLVPAIVSVQNNYGQIPAGLPNSALAPGSLIFIKGTNLSSVNDGQTLRSSASPGLQNTIGGVSVTVTVNGISLNCPLYYLSPGQINAIVPRWYATGQGNCFCH